MRINFFERNCYPAVPCIIFVHVCALYDIYRIFVSVFSMLFVGYSFSLFRLWQFVVLTYSLSLKCEDVTRSHKRLWLKSSSSYIHTIYELLSYDYTILYVSFNMSRLMCLFGCLFDAHHLSPVMLSSACCCRCCCCCYVHCIKQYTYVWLRYSRCFAHAHPQSFFVSYAQCFAVFFGCSSSSSVAVLLGCILSFSSFFSFLSRVRTH